MHAAILYELTGDPDVDEIPSQLDGQLPAIDATGTQYLDGKTLYHGQAADRITEDVDVPSVTSDGITTEKEEQSRRVLTDYYVDLEAGWAGIDSSDGEFFVDDLLVSLAGVVAEEREIALDAWASDFLDATDPYVWGLNYGEEDADGDSVRAGSAFHTDVDIKDVRENLNSLSGVGFRYDWDERARPWQHLRERVRRRVQRLGARYVRAVSRRRGPSVPRPRDRDERAGNAR